MRNQIRHFLVLATAGILLVGCKPYDETPDLHQIYEDGGEIQIPQQKQDRFSIERVQVVKDKLGYESKRGIYIIKDKTTGKEYLGVSGIGISELSTTSSGKTSHTIER